MQNMRTGVSISNIDREEMQKIVQQMALLRGGQCQSSSTVR
jgi:hypothetical protein